jgi:hypothetical protein
MRAPVAVYLGDRAMRIRLADPRVLLLCFVAACSEAGGEVRGGDPLFQPKPSPTTPSPGTPLDNNIAGGITWTELYKDYFGGRASCSKNPGKCHQKPEDNGSRASGFACGDTKEECHAGLLASGRVTGNTFADTQLFGALRKSNPPDPNNPGFMPESPLFSFGPVDIKRISDWYAAGKKND